MTLKVARAGVILVETLEELGDVTEILLRCPPMARGRHRGPDESGAFKALTLDLAESAGLPLPVIDDGDSPALRAAMPDFVPRHQSARHDRAGAGRSRHLPPHDRGLLDDDTRFGSVVLGIIQTDADDLGDQVPADHRRARRRPPHKPVIFAGLDEGAPVPAEYIARLRAIGVPYFPSSERALRALARIAAWRARDRAPARPRRRSHVDLPAERRRHPRIPRQGTARAARRAVPAAARWRRRRRGRGGRRSARLSGRAQGAVGRAEPQERRRRRDRRPRRCGRADARPGRR